MRRPGSIGAPVGRSVLDDREYAAAVTAVNELTYQLRPPGIDPGETYRSVAGLALLGLAERVSAEGAAQWDRLDGRPGGDHARLRAGPAVAGGERGVAGGRGGRCWSNAGSRGRPPAPGEGITWRRYTEPEHRGVLAAARGFLAGLTAEQLKARIVITDWEKVSRWFERERLPNAHREILDYTVFDQHGFHTGSGSDMSRTASIDSPQRSEATWNG